MRITTLLVTSAILIVGAPIDEAAAQFKKRNREPPRGPTPIACTSTGCAPIPAGCRIETGFSQEGMLSGYDAVVCPVR